MRREGLILAGILLCYVVLGVYYSVTVPIFEAPDEVEHFFYVYHVASTGELPVVLPGDYGPWRQEGTQPPLYYLIAGMLIRPIPVERIADYLWDNPHRNIGVPFEPGNKNFFVHTERERWPYRGLPLAVHVARWFSLFLGLLTVFGTYLLAREVWPDRPYLALAATATVAFIPQFVFITTAVSNDAAIACTATWSTWWAVRRVNRGGGYRHAALLGVLVGLAMLSKLSGLAMLPFAMLALLIARVRGAWSKPLGRSLLLLVVMAGLVSGWWYARNWLLYGDPTALNRMLDVVGTRPFNWSPSYLLAEWRGLRWSFWGLFGWFNVPMGRRAYQVLDGVLALIAVGWAVGLLRSRLPGKTTPNWAALLLALWAAVVFVSLWRWVTMTYGAQGRLLFPAVAALAALFAWGWSQLAPPRVRAFWTALLPFGLLGLAALAPSRWIAPAYAYPPRIRPEAIPVTAKRVDFLFGNRIRLWAVNIHQITVHPGDIVDVTLYLSKAGPLPVDYSLSIHLLGRELEDVGAVDTFPGWGTYPTRLWRDGEVIVDTYQVRVKDQARTPTLLRVSVGFYNYWTRQTLPVTTLDGRPVQPLALVGSLRLVARHPEAFEPQVRLHAVYGDEIALVGMDPPPAEVAPGDVLRFRLYWQALRPARASYTVFTHLIRTEDPVPVAQHDKVPLDGDYPTLAWAPGEVVADSYEIRLPPELPPGEYYLIAGLYQWPTLQRLPLVEGPANPRVSEAATLARITVRPKR